MCSCVFVTLRLCLYGFLVVRDPRLSCVILDLYVVDQAGNRSCRKQGSSRRVLVCEECAFLVSFSLLLLLLFSTLLLLFFPLFFSFSPFLFPPSLALQIEMTWGMAGAVCLVGSLFFWSFYRPARASASLLPFPSSPSWFPPSSFLVDRGRASTLDRGLLPLDMLAIFSVARSYSPLRPLWVGFTSGIMGAAMHFD